VRLLNHSVVIVAQAHNPSILNTDFLARRSIVPEEWGWELGTPVVCTPPLAQVPYLNGVSLICDPNKLQIVDAGQKLDPSTSKVRQIAEAYVTTLPHVPYTSVGVNFSAAFVNNDPEGLLVKRFLKDGPWNESPDRVSAVGLRLVYPLDGGHLRVSLDSGEIEDPASGTRGRVRVVVVGGNFHHDCSGANRADDLVPFLRRVGGFWDRFSEVAGRLVQGG
jgi:hypothetical protein